MRPILTSLGMTVVLALALSAACQGRPATAKSRALVVDANASGKVIVVQEMDTVSIKLVGNASTGYHWERVSVEGSSLALADDVPHEAAPPDLNPLACGNSSDVFIDFRVTGSGPTRVRLEYRAPDGHTVGGTFNATFDVRGAAGAAPVH